ncbi:hypothetical protein I8751_11495 [Nostocaceae cyanobacterium CENA357]|uniref:Uncharacterized protein n=1 Tax=Atlanticothrix silvestris CENA357 TaxID=1725252 RepID=A0A8J7KZN8_9CYAN|nr:hypothetical protein [Atlanticothrix silvestris]MBH8552980.1 hypothetical protein [Atlanticothrix silvestris CENA357]
MTTVLLELDIQTQQIVKDAIADSGVSLDDFVTKACRAYARTIANNKVRQVGEDLNTASTKQLMTDGYRTYANRSEQLIKLAILALENHNNNCTKKSQKWHINQNILQSLTRSKPTIVKKMSQKYKTRLDDHNNKHGLNPYDNCKPEIKIEQSINLAEIDI